MHAVERRVSVDRKRDINVDNLAFAGSRRTEPQSESGIRECAEIAAAQGIRSPGTPHIDKNGAAHSKQSERIPIGIVALLDRKQSARIAALITQRKAAQPIFTAQKQRVIDIQVM